MFILFYVLRLGFFPNGIFKEQQMRRSSGNFFISLVNLIRSLMNAAILGVLLRLKNGDISVKLNDGKVAVLTGFI